MGFWNSFNKKIPKINYMSIFESNFSSDKRANPAYLLPLMLLLPYTRGWNYPTLIAVTSICVLFYANLTADLQELGKQIQGYWLIFTTRARRFLIRMYEPLDRLEKSFMNLQNLGTMLNQLIFFGSCSALLLPGQPVTGLYTLMFYNVFAYCVSYIKELYEREDWSPYVNVTEHSNLKHLAMTATKIALEWTKAVTFIITLVFMLLVFGLEQGLENYKPTACYTLLTWMYYASTEKVFVILLSYFVNYLQLPIFENLEALWLPVILYLFNTTLSFIIAVLSIMFGRFKFALIALYLNVYLKLKELNEKQLKELSSERGILLRFRCASRDELSSLEDVCAVCLSTMNFARVTPCNHLFHGDCLRKCLKASSKCPICKRVLISI